MNNIIFNKYSNERDNKFKIRTSIIKNAKNELIIEKVPLHNDAKFHINNMSNSYKNLCDNYDEEVISINKCRLKDCKIEFEYINGQTLEQIIDSLIEINNMNGILKLLNKYKNIVYSVKTKEMFTISEEFIEIFGDINFADNLISSSISNIDINLSNIIIYNSKWNLIDYEWTFSFPIPLNYTIYRAIKHYVNSSKKRMKLEALEIYNIFGISNQELELYEIMESNFQNYVLGKSIAGWNIYNCIHGKCINANSLADVYLQKLKNGIQIFFDYGNGFSEIDSTKLYLEQDDYCRCIFRIDLTDRIRNIRIDPADDYCIIFIDKLRGFNKDYYDIGFSTNGSVFDNKTIIFNTIDPQIYLDAIPADTIFVEVVIVIKELQSNLSFSLCNSLNDINQANDIQKCEIERLENENKELLEKKSSLENVLGEYEKTSEEDKKEIEENKKEIERLGNNLKEIKGQKFNLEELVNEYQNQIMFKDDVIDKIMKSSSWKITKPFRRMHEFLKRKKL